MRLWLPALGTLALACNTMVRVDPEGHRCNELDPCPTGYACVAFACRLTSSPLGGGAFFGGGFTTGGGESGGGDATGGGGVMNGGGDTAGGASGGVAPTSGGSTAGGFTAGGSTAGGSTAGGFTGGGSTGGGATGGGSACAQVMCNTVPAPACMGARTARAFLPPGRCEPATGTCLFDVVDTDCGTGSCANGLCSLSVTQTAPRVRFRISAIDVAPGSGGSTVLAVGTQGQVAAWNGTRWQSVTPPVAGQSLRAVNFTSQNLAWVVGGNRTVWRWDRATQTFLATPAPSGLSPTATLIGVDGVNDTSVLVADTAGNWAKWNGTTWASGALPTTSASAFNMTSVWVDETQRERIAGSCNNAMGGRRSCVGYRNPMMSPPGTWFVDVEDADSRQCVSVGPWVDVPASGGQDALCGFDDNASLRHTPQGDLVTSGLSLSTGTGIVGITGGPPSALTRPVWLLTSSLSGQGRLYRLTGTGAAPAPVAQLDTFFGEEHLSPSESTGVVVSETEPVKGVNNVFYRRTAPTERTEALDLGLDFAGVTSFLNELTLVSSDGDLAIQRTGTETFEFRRPPSSGPQYNIEDAEGRNGAMAVLVVGRDGANAGLIARVSMSGYTRLTTSAPGTTFKAVCRASDVEAWAVGTGGAVFSIGATLATRDSSVVTVNDLLGVDCPLSGEAVACGANSTVLRKTATGWVPVPFPIPGRTLTSCKLRFGSLWVAGDGVFARLDPGSTTWTMLPARGALGHLVVRAPNDVLGLSSANASNFDVVRYDGMAWSTVLSGVSGTPGGGVQVGGRVVWGASAGVLVEGR